jgi:sigma-B regulation protein RsbU (phosphoserine phosphatase)
MRRVLLVNPQHKGVEALRQPLCQRGFQLQSLETLEELLGTAKSSQPDLILVGGTAWEPCQGLSRDPQTEHIPVVFISRADEREQCLNNGATDHIADTEPVEASMARIQTILQLKEEVRQAQTLVTQLTEINQQLYERNTLVEKEMYTARQLQQSLLPPCLEKAVADTGVPESRLHFQNGQCRISGLYMPCDALGGDLYDVIQFANGTVGVAVADVSGHGLPAGFITAIFKATLFRLALSIEAPGDLLYQLNNELSDIVKTGDYVTGVYARLVNGQLEYSGAGHPYPIHYQAGTGQLQFLKENGTPLVWMKDMLYDTGKQPLAPGDKVLLYSDGVTEMKNIHGDLLGDERLMQLFAAAVKDEKPLNTLLSALSDFTEGHPLEDDVSMVLIEVL